MFVIKRDGRTEEVHFDKITARINKLSYGLDPLVQPVRIAQKVVQGVYTGVKTSELDTLAAETAAYLTTEHPDYAQLAARIAVSNLHKDTTKSFSATVQKLYEYRDGKRKAQLIADDVYEIVQENKAKLDSAIVYDRDYTYDYFGFKTLERSYLLRINGEIVERPQHLLMRVALGIHKQDVDAAIETYNLMSLKYFTHASPTLFNSGTCHPQLSSCFLVAMKDDSIDGIYDTLKTCAMISKSAGGIGLHIHNIRARDSYITGTNGTSNGLIPMLRVFNATARYVDQGGGKRPGAFAMYLEPWHPDLLDFIELRKNTGSEENRTRDLFLALWIPDLFMKRVEANEEWSFFCPMEAPGLADCCGEEFEKLYTEYEAKGLARKTMSAQSIFFSILEAQVETGTPYLLYKDAANLKSNQKNLGIIKSSNLCTEIMEYSSPDETAVCNLASVSLARFIDDETRTYDFDKLVNVVRVMTRNLNKVIDVNYYPVESAKRSNLRHRPVGLGVQGLADVFAIMRMPFDSPEARALNKDIFEAIYYAAVTASIEIAKRDGPYETYEGSPMSQGILQFDMWGVTPSDRFDWDQVRKDLAAHGIRNSLLVAPMPTASTSQILGNNECFEPFTSNLYARRVVAGEFAVVNRHLLRELQNLGLWNNTMKQRIMADNGSVQNIESIPQEVRAIFKTAWEISQRVLVDMAADRGAFIDQSQSLNLFMATPNFAKLSSMHFYAWKKGLKTGCYYLRVKPAADAIKFTIDKAAMDAEKQKEKRLEEMVCSLTNREACVSCSG